MSNVPSESAPNAADIRRRLRGSDAAAPAETATAVAELPRPGRDSGKIVLPRRSSGVIPRPPQVRSVGPSTRTPLPHELAHPTEELARLRAENVELRALIEQAITQEEENERRGLEWLAEIEGRDGQIRSLDEQVRALSSGFGEAGELVKQIQDRDASIRSLQAQVRSLEQNLQLAQQSGTEAEFLTAIAERDGLIEAANARVAELEIQIASIPPPPPTDEELAKMADELERERCKITQIRKELEDEKRQHSQDETDFERQMRDMEVQLSKERADMARQRTELSRLQAEVRSEIEAIQRGDGVLRERLSSLHSQRRGSEASGVHSKPGDPEPNRSKDSGFMRRLFGKH